MTSSNPRHPDDETIRLWLDLAADDALPADEATRLEAALAARPELAAERHEIERLHADLSVRIEVRAGFRDAVMAALPRASWERASRPAWGLGVAIAALLAAGSVALLLLAGTEGAGPAPGLLAAVGDLLRASALAGAGLLGASWRGLGLALAQVLDASPGTLILFALALAALNLLFFRLLRRRTLAARRDAGRRE